MVAATALSIPAAAQSAPQIIDPDALPDDPLDLEQAASDFETLLVAPIQSETDDYRADAEALHRELVVALEQSAVLVDINEVPDFEQYDARLYMLACPPGGYAGCALVVGERAEVDWVVGGTLSGAPPEQTLDVSFVDIARATEVMTFSVPIDGSEDADVTGGIASVFGQVLSGAFDQVDVREDLDGSARDDDKVDVDQVAASLSELEDSLGEVALGASDTPLERPKLTREDLREYDDREDLAPWLKLDMTEDEYLDYRNSGLSLESWHQEGRGRAGQLLFRLGGGYGTGPFEHTFDGKVALSAEDLSPVQTVQYQEVTNAAGPMVEFEVGAGLTPWLELAAVIGWRWSEFTIFTDEHNLANEFDVEGSPSKSTITTNQYGAHVGFAPFVRWPVRPLVTAGAVWWQGKTFKPDGNRFKRLDAPSFLLLHLSPGVEASAGQNINIYGRVMSEIPLGVGATFLEEYEEGPAALEKKPVPQDEHGPGFTIQVGVQLRVGPFGKKSDGATSTRTFEFEDEDL